VPGQGRTPRDERRRSLGQNFLRRAVAERVVDEAGVVPGELVLDIGAGAGALTLAAAERGARVLAVEIDPDWARRLRSLARSSSFRGRITVVEADFLGWRLPRQPFRVLSCPPFGATTSILHRLLDRPSHALQRADLVVQWEVARKRAATPPDTLVSTAWAPWWAFSLGRRIPAREFRPVPRVDAGVLTVVRRSPPLLPVELAPSFGGFVRRHWPFSAPPTW